MKKIPKYKQTPIRAQQIKLDADKLREEKFFISSILNYTIYTEQILLTAYLYILREDNLSRAIDKREELFRKKEKGYFPFGEVVSLTIPVIKERLSKIGTLPVEESSIEGDIESLAKRLGNIRNMVSAHPYFVLMLDPTNRFKKTMLDVNYYRKVLRRLKKMMFE